MRTYVSKKYMNIAQEVIKEERYKNFTLLKRPKPFSIFAKNKNYLCVQVHSLEQIRGGGIVGFCGEFGWDVDKLTPIDGDSYNPNMMVFGYNTFFHLGHKCLDILVGDDW